MTWASLQAEVAAEFAEFGGRHDAQLQALERAFRRSVWSHAVVACRRCKSVFVPLKADRVFCSERCRLHERRRRKLGRRSAIACGSCGVEFVALNTHRLYCSARCRIRRSCSTRAHCAWMAALKQRRTAARAALVCKCCGIQFAGARSDQRYCSPLCGNRDRAHRYVRKARSHR